MTATASPVANPAVSPNKDPIGELSAAYLHAWALLHAYSVKQVS
jgi:hypothetical protein